MAVPTISTRYRDRDRNYQQIADNIAEVVSVQRGNYIVFFPSFVFLEQVRRLLPTIGYKVISQHRTMEEHERKYVLNLLQNGNNRHLILAVQGGIFAEGVDYPGKMVIGVFWGAGFSGSQNRVEAISTIKAFNKRIEVNVGPLPVDYSLAIVYPIELVLVDRSDSRIVFKGKVP